MKFEKKNDQKYLHTESKNFVPFLFFLGIPRPATEKFLLIREISTRGSRQNLIEFFVLLIEFFVLVVS